MEKRPTSTKVVESSPSDVVRRKLLPKILEVAYKEGSKSVLGYRFGAVVWKGGKILQSGYNHMQMNPLDISGRPYSIHAEKDALKGLRLRETYGAALLCMRVTATKTMNPSRPCRGCLKLLKRRRLKEIWYYNHAGILVKEPL